MAPEDTLAMPRGISGGIHYDPEAFGRFSETLARFFGTARFLAIQSILVVMWITFNAVAATVSHIETNPEIGTTISTDGHTRRTLVARFPYQVVYRLRPTEIVIVAIAHLKRRPGYWKSRS